VSATEIAFVNQLGNATDLTGTESLIVPVAAVSASSIAHSTRYVARKGDTLVTVADRFNVSVEQLRGWNHLKGNTLAPGHSLYVSEPARVATTSGHRRAKHGSAASSSHGAAVHTKQGATTNSSPSAHLAKPAPHDAKATKHRTHAA
jgi:membrane-bound lytic murein transglycosylase D